jgi:hypothetical protein
VSSINFPNNPGIGTIFTNVASGFSYQWDGYVWNSYTPASVTNIAYVDDIATSFNGITQTFSLFLDGVPVRPASPEALLVSIGGVVQEPNIDYTISDNNITFSTAPEAGLFFFAVSYGSAFNVTQFSLSNGVATEGDFNVSGRLNITGVTSTAGGLNASQGADLSRLRVVGISTFSGGLNASQGADLSRLRVVGITTLGNATATAFVSGSVGIGTTNPTSALTVKGNTSLETLSVSGVSTFQNDTYFQDSTHHSTNPTRAYFGSLDEMSIYSTGTYLGNSYNYIDASSGYLDIRNLRTTIRNSETTTQRDLAIFDATTFNSEFVKLYYGGNEKFATLGAGVTVTGTTFTNQLSVSGVSTYTSSVRVGVNTSSGVILTSPNGTKYQLFVENDGTLKTIAV